MKHQEMKFALTAIWMVGVMVVIGMAGYLRSTSDVLMLATFAAAPPAAMWFWWNDPAEALNQQIQTVHGNGIGKRPGFTRAGRRLSAIMAVTDPIRRD
jgi:hypothetical protein